MFRILYVSATKHLYISTTSEINRMKFKRRVFQVKKGQKYITIPAQAPIEAGDYVLIELVTEEE